MRHQGAKQIENMENIKSKAKAWPFKLSKH